MIQYTEGTPFPSIAHIPLKRNGEKVWIETATSTVQIKTLQNNKTVGHL